MRARIARCAGMTFALPRSAIAAVRIPLIDCALVRETTARRAAANTKAKEAVSIATTEISFSGSKLSYKFPAHPLTQLFIAQK